jgi:hypothetical protein
VSLSHELTAYPVSRRTVLRGGAVGFGAVALSGSLGVGLARSQPAQAATLPVVVPLSSMAVHDNFGYAAHPDFQKSVYKYIDAWASRLASMGVTYFRGLYCGAGHAPTAAAIAACRKYGLKWVMLVTEEVGSTVDKTRARVQHIADFASDVCKAIEGMNEPNEARSASEIIPDNWAEIAVQHQAAIWETSRKPGSKIASVPIIGPSLHDVAAWNSYTKPQPTVGGPKHYHQLAAAGITKYQTHVGLHRYPAYDPRVTLGSGGLWLIACA